MDDAETEENSVKWLFFAFKMSFIVIVARVLAMFQFDNKEINITDIYQQFQLFFPMQNDRTVSPGRKFQFNFNVCSSKRGFDI